MKNFFPFFSVASRAFSSIKYHRNVNNGIARLNWVWNEGATFTIKRAMEVEPKPKVTLPNLVEDKVLEELF